VGEAATRPNSEQSRRKIVAKKAKKGQKGKKVQKGIPAEVKERAEEIVERFNRESLGGRGVRYVARFQGSFLYLDRHGAGAPGPICRLKYTGSPDKWDFAIFKYSSETYDSQEWFFPGSQFVDGTIEGALKAGMAAYPA
jgi:hypothetical protein